MEMLAVGAVSCSPAYVCRCNRETEINKVEDDRKKLTDVAKESVMLTQFHDSYVRHKHHSDRLKVRHVH